MRLSRGKPFLFTRRWTERQRVVLLTLIGINAAVFIAQFSLDTFQFGFVRDYLALSNRGVHDAYAWQFITAMFLHAGPWHFLGNILVLYFLGRDVESILGQRHFLSLFLAGAIGGELGHLFLMPTDTVLFAASGGVAAVVIAYATILPELDLIAFKLFVISVRLKAKHLGCGLVVVALLMLCIGRTGAVSHSALLGGCAVGWLYAHLLGFGRPFFLQRRLQQRRATAERYRQMTAEEFIEQEIDPLLEKISRSGIDSLTRAERRILSRAHEKVR